MITESKTVRSASYVYVYVYRDSYASQRWSQSEPLFSAIFLAIRDLAMIDGCSPATCSKPSKKSKASSHLQAFMQSLRISYVISGVVVHSLSKYLVVNRPRVLFKSFAQEQPEFVRVVVIRLDQGGINVLVRVPR